MVVHTCNLGTWEVAARGSETQGHPQLLNNLKANLVCTEPCSKFTNGWMEKLMNE